MMEEKGELIDKVKGGMSSEFKNEIEKIENIFK